MKRFFTRFFSVLIIAIVILVGAFLIYGTINDYKPKESITLELQGGGKPFTIQNDDTLSILSWNIGYGGLGATMDFFYDGGNRVIPSEEYFRKCIDNILQNLNRYKDYDFILLQEVDSSSKRSYLYNQVDTIGKLLSDYHYSFGLNYKVKFVPVPMGRPMGKVVAGQMTLSLADPTSSERIAYPGNYGWPKRIFMLDRCFILNRYDLSNGKELVVLNTHNSAFDSDGKMRKQEFGLLRRYMLDEYEKGNYVIAGGDWNTNPKGFDKSLIEGDSAKTVHPQADPEMFPEKWIWVFDPVIATNRDVSTAYEKGKTACTIIDFYVLSPNIELLEVKTIDMQYEASDHQPVSLSIKLK